MKKTILLYLTCFLTGSLYANGYIKPPMNAHEYSVTHERTSLPAAYDSRDEGIILPVRDQKIEGTCWAFAVTDALQALYHKNGFNTGYLSPQSFVTCFRGFDIPPVTKGGNEQMAGSMLARLEGIVKEQALPYNPYQTSCVSYEKKNTPMYTLGWYLLPKDDAIAIKKCIMEFGSVTASFRYETSCYDQATNTHEYKGEEGVNHGISLIGWDDSKNAWLAKNNWGSQKFDNGFLWISYNDDYITTECVAYTDYTPTESIDDVYHQNTVGMVGSFGIDEPGYLTDAIVRYDFENGDQLVALGTYATYPNTKICYNLISKDLTRILFTSDTITVPYKGFYKYTLPEPFHASDSLHIAVTYLNKDAEDGHIIPIEMDHVNYTTITLGKEPQWIAFDNEDWMPFGKDTEFPHNLCIYAYVRHGEISAIDMPTTSSIYNGREIVDSAWDNAQKIQLFDTNGKLIKTFTQQNGQFSDIPYGIYILSVEYKNGTCYGEKILYKPNK